MLTKKNLRIENVLIPNKLALFSHLAERKKNGEFFLNNFPLDQNKNK